MPRNSAVKTNRKSAATLQADASAHNIHSGFIRATDDSERSLAHNGTKRQPGSPTGSLDGPRSRTRAPNAPDQRADAASG